MTADVGGEAIFVRCYSQQYPIAEQTVRAMSYFVNLPGIGWVRRVFLSDTNQEWKQTGIKNNIKYYLQKTVTNCKKFSRYKISANITFKQRYSQRKETVTSWCDRTPYSLFHLNCYYDIPDWTSFWVYGVTRAYLSFKQRKFSLFLSICYLVENQM